MCARSASTLLKDGESALNNHVLARNFAKYSQMNDIIKYYYLKLLFYCQNTAIFHSFLQRTLSRDLRYDTRCYFNVRSKADISQLNLPHGFPRI